MTFEELENMVAEQNRTISDLEAERDSLRAENDRLIAADKERAEELRKTKELNFTLARQAGRADAPRAEDIIKDMF